MPEIAEHLTAYFSRKPSASAMNRIDVHIKLGAAGPRVTRQIEDEGPCPQDGTSIVYSTHTMQYLVV